LAKNQPILQPTLALPGNGEKFPAILALLLVGFSMQSEIASKPGGLLLRLFTLTDLSAVRFLLHFPYRVSPTPGLSPALFSHGARTFLCFNSDLSDPTLYYIKISSVLTAFSN